MKKQSQELAAEEFTPAKRQEKTHFEPGLIDSFSAILRSSEGKKVRLCLKGPSYLKKIRGEEHSSQRKRDCGCS